jgi:hypothetical protein
MSDMRVPVQGDVQKQLAREVLPEYPGVEFLLTRESGEDVYVGDRDILVAFAKRVKGSP